MEIVRFLKWWWNRRTGQEQILLTMPLFMVVFFGSLFTFGLKALAFFAMLVFIGLISCFLNMIFKAFKREWSIYKKEKEREADIIVSRLRGY